MTSVNQWALIDEAHSVSPSHPARLPSNGCHCLVVLPQPEGVPCHLKQIKVGCFPWWHGQQSGECPRGSMDIEKIPSLPLCEHGQTVNLVIHSFPVLYKFRTAPNPASDLCPREILPLATSSPRLSACALCCNTAKYLQFQLLMDFIKFHIVWTAYNQNVIRSYKQHHRALVGPPAKGTFSHRMCKGSC